MDITRKNRSKAVQLEQTDVGEGTQTSTGSLSDVADMMKAFQDVQTTNKIILQRLTEAVSNLDQNCTCPCHTQGKESEIDDIKARIDYFEQEDEKKGLQLQQLNNQLLEIQSVLINVQKTLKEELESKSSERTDLSGQLETAGTSPNVESVAEIDMSEHLDSVPVIPHGIQLDPHFHKGIPTPGDNETGVDIVVINISKTDSNATAVANHAASVESETGEDNGTALAENTTADPSSADALSETEAESACSSQSAEMTVEKVVFISDEEAAGSDYISTIQARKDTAIVDPDRAIKHATTDNGNNRILHPNFKLQETCAEPLMAPSPSPDQPVTIVCQTQPKYIHKELWNRLAAQELEEGKAAGMKDLGGVHSILCLDISESIAKSNGWEQTTKFCLDYLNGLAKMAQDHGICDEYVAMVTFGHNCGVAKRFTNHMDELLQTLNSLQLGGPTSLFGGLWMSYGAAGSSERTCVVVNGTPVPTKIIMVTDGRPSDVTLYEGPDVETHSNKDETMAHIMDCLDTIQNSRVDIFMVPVGDADMEFFELMRSNNCKILSHNDGMKMAKRLFLTLQLQISDLFSSLGPGAYGSQTMSEDDKELLAELKKEKHHHLVDDIIRSQAIEIEQYVESSSGIFPPVGTRVRRGPDWTWNNQDSNGPGTIIGHYERGGQMWVHWDRDDHRNIYSYEGQKYDVLPVDEPRIIKPQDNLKVGCVVRPGKDWDKLDTRVKSFDRGVVIRLLFDVSKVQVRWSKDVRGDYKYEVNGIQEVEYCPPDNTWPSAGGYVLGGSSQTRPRNKNKSKNKNNP